MTALKVIANIILSLLLFLCLVVMGIAVTVNATALSSGFITGQIDRLDVVTLFKDEAVPELQKNEELAQHPEVIASFQTAVENNAPALKSAINKAVSDVYSYVLGNESLDLKLTLRNSILKPDLAAAIINDLDLRLFIRDRLMETLPLRTMTIAAAQIDLKPYMYDVAVAVQPWFKKQIINNIPAIYDYMLGDSSTLDASIDITPSLDDIRTALKTAVMDSPPPALASLSQTELSLAFDAAWTLTLPQIPTSINLTSSETVADQPSEIPQALDDAETGLAQARLWAGYFKLALWVLVIVILLWIGLIILVNRDVRINCRLIGGLFVTYGIGETIGILVSRGFIRSLVLSEFDAPASLQSWVSQLIASLTNPLLIFSICCAVTGVILIVLSFFYHRTPSISPQPETA